MKQLEVIQITALTAILFNALLAALVLVRDYRSRLYQIYMAWGVAATLWNLGVYHLSQPDISKDDAFVWAKVLQLGVMFIPVILFHMCMNIAQVRTGWLMPAMYLAHVGLAVSLFFNEFIVNVKYLPVGYWSVPGPGFHVFGVIYTLIVVYLLNFLYRRQKISPPMQRKRLRAMLAAIIGLTIFGTNDLMPIMGQETYPFTNIKFYPLGSLAAIFYVLIIGYSVLQHRLLDIHVTLSRFAAQFVRLCFMMLVGFLLLLVMMELSPGLYSQKAFGASLLVLLVSAVVASVLFPQFFGKGSDKLERQILGDQFEYHARVQALIQTMRSFPDPESLKQELQNLLAGTMKMTSYHIILLDDTTRGFRLFQCHPGRAGMEAPELQVDSPVFKHFQRSQAKWLPCNTTNESERETLLAREARLQLKPYDVEFALPFFVADDLIGLMLLGPKAGGELYTLNDLRLMGELSSSLGLVLNQIRLRQQLQVVHEQDLLGRMSRGLAHDLNNLLTPVQTLLQLCNESGLNQSTINELLPMSLRNLETVRSYVNEALFFSRSAKLQGHPGRLDEMVRESIVLTQPLADGKKIRLTYAGISEVTIEMDAVLIKRLICNLISNAVDASPAESEIQAHLAPLQTTDATRDWYRLRIIDHGEGISAENLSRVFTPYFTTKNTGDGKRGFGLGLAISRKIAHLHGGNLSITSKEKSGTIVQVDLPCQLNPGQTAPTPPNPRLNMMHA